MDDIRINGHLGEIRFGAMLDRASALELFERTIETPRFMACSVYLWDFTGCDVVLDTVEMKALAERYSEMIPTPRRRCKIALVADAPATRSRLMIMRSLLGRSERAEYRLFDRVSAARLWLAVRPHWTGNFPTMVESTPGSR